MARLGMLMDHPHIVKIIGALIEEDKGITVMIENFDIGFVASHWLALLNLSRPLDRYLHTTAMDAVSLQKAAFDICKALVFMETSGCSRSPNLPQWAQFGFRPLGYRGAQRHVQREGMQAHQLWTLQGALSQMEYYLSAVRRRPMTGSTRACTARH